MKDVSIDHSPVVGGARRSLVGFGVLGEVAVGEVRDRWGALSGLPFCARVSPRSDLGQPLSGDLTCLFTSYRSVSADGRSSLPAIVSSVIDGIDAPPLRRDLAGEALEVGIPEDDVALTGLVFLDCAFGQFHVWHRIHSYTWGKVVGSN